MTSLSTGKAIYSLLSSDAGITRRVRKIFPVVADDAQMPYIAYRRVGLSINPQKLGLGADTVSMEVTVFTESYEEGVSLAELVRSALETYTSKEVCGLHLRSCYLEASEETWGDDAYVQRLVFNVRIQ